MMKQLLSTSYLYGGNAPFIEELYDAYLHDPTSVADGWREYFDALQGQPGHAIRDVAHGPVIAAFAALAKQSPMRTVKARGVKEKQAAVLQLIGAYRFLGDRWADLDPLRRAERRRQPELELSYHGLTESDLHESFATGSFLGAGSQGGQATLGKILDALHQTYCGKVGVEYMYLTETAQKRWIQARLEPIRATPTLGAESKRRYLERLTAAETLERFLHTRYVGQKRFSLEGGESLIVAMDELVRTAGAMGAKEVVIGMAHRGRLNVLVNVLGKSPSLLFDEFEDKTQAEGSAGDEKYHMGHSSDVATPGGPVHLAVAFNPSHLEIVNPVVEGSVYARQVRRASRAGENPRWSEAKAQVFPVLIHGDAAVAGQGVNQEMLNFAQTRGYGTGGTIHVVVNNQIGFTTSDPRDYRSSLYCTDIFKMVEAPIFHVNGDDPEAVAFVTGLAVEFRQEFKKDVVVDIVCYRKLGHNEQDEPMVTQPLMYKRVARHPGTRKLYADRLEAQGVLAPGYAEQLIQDCRGHLERGELLYNPVLSDFRNTSSADWKPYLGRPYIETVDTRVPTSDLTRLATRLATVPEGFELHSRVSKVLDDRRAMSEGRTPVDWGMAENLAYATLLASGIGVRISGEDVGRGTFFHRHATLHSQTREKWDEGVHMPLLHLQEGQARFECYDSVLSEEAVLAFEYGYATTEPTTLVVWEAQFGDFANGAQVVIDQFIAAGESKWGRACGLTLLLPHGYEGQGAEHSSARLERFLQLCAESNMEVCVPTTAAQIFHLLRRQMLRQQRKPLVVMTPKSLLRHKAAASELDDLAHGEFHRVIGEVEELDARAVRRVVLCSGKVYFDLLAGRRAKGIKDTALLRIEQLYPFPDASFREEMAKYPNATEVVWTQEEPQNQGAWYWFASRQHLQDQLGCDKKLLLVSRPASSAPAVGSHAKHCQQQHAIVEAALGSIEA